MNLEHNKRYILRCGMITPPLNERHGGISFDIPDSPSGVSSGISWHPNGICSTPLDCSADFDVVAEVHRVILIEDQVYRGCKIEKSGSCWNWRHLDYDGAPDAGGANSDGKLLGDTRRGRCGTVQECMDWIDDLYEE